MTTVRIAAVLAIVVAGLAGQGKPKPNSTLTIAVPTAGSRSLRVHGHTPMHYLDRGKYPLVVVLGDRGLAGAMVVRSLPHAVLDRKRMVAVAPELVSSDYEADGYPQLLAAMPGVIDAVGKTWSVDERRVFLYGVGRAAPLALALGRDLGDRFVAVAALAPESSSIPGTPRPGRLPALVVSPGAKKKTVADELLRSAKGQLDVKSIERSEVASGQGEALFQPLVEWFVEFTLKKPENEEDLVKNRTVAASGSKNRVVCIQGDFDTVEDVLTTLKIPHLAMDWGAFAEFDLGETDVLLINCSGGAAYGPVRVAANKKVREFVQKGGYLFSTDWALRWPVAEVFGDSVRVLDPDTPDMLVDVKPAAGALNHELLQHVFPIDQPLPRWQIDSQSYLMELKVPGRSEVLLESEELGAAFKGNKILGACFRHGAYDGLVFDVVSHFSHQGDGMPTTPMYQLIVNFINAAKQRRESRR